MVRDFEEADRYMAETITTSSGSAPQSKSVSPVLFWIVAAVLAIAVGVVFFLVNKDLNDTRDKFAEALKGAIADQDAKREKAVADAKQQLTAEIAKQQEKIVKLEADKEKIAGDVATLRKDHDGFATTVNSFKKEHDAKIAETASNLTTTNSNVQRVEVEVKYLKENVEKINGKLTSLDKDIANLGTGQSDLKAALQKEHDQLTKEVLAVSTKSGVTEEELKKLELKTSQFEVKVLNERARQAAIAARKGDHKSVLDLLDFKN